MGIRTRPRYLAWTICYTITSITYLYPFTRATPNDPFIGSLEQSGGATGFTYPDWIFPGQLLSDDEKLASFDSWMHTSSSMNLHPGVRLWNFGQGRRFGIRAIADVPKLQVLCDIPVRDMLCGTPFDPAFAPENVSASDMPFEWDPHEPASDDAPLATLDETVLGAAANFIDFKLIYELLLGERSRWKAYIDMMPSLSEYEEYAVLLWSEESRLEWVAHGTLLHRALHAQLMASSARSMNTQLYLCKKFGGIATPLMRRLLCDKSLLRWAAVVMSTRAWGLSAAGSCLIPFADVFNHGSDRNSLFPVYGRGLNDPSQNGGILTSTGIFSGRDYAAGDEMKQTYLVNLAHSTFFISNSFTPREGHFVIENPDYDTQYMLDTSALKYTHQLNCWAEKPRLHYGEDDVTGAASCSMNATLLTCYRLRRSQDVRVAESIMSAHRKRLKKAGKLAAQGANPFPGQYEAVHFSTDDSWRAPIPLKVKASDRAAVADVLGDIRRHHSLLRTTRAADVELSERGSTRALRNIGTFRVNERRAIEYCMAAVSRHLDKIDSLSVRVGSGEVGTEGRGRRRENGGDVDVDRGGGSVDRRDAGACEVGSDGECAAARGGVRRKKSKKNRKRRQNVAKSRSSSKKKKNTSTL